jgi:hypothetical protein
MESLGEMEYLNPGDCVTLEEEWELYEADTLPTNDEADIKELIGRYI